MTDTSVRETHQISGTYNKLKPQTKEMLDGYASDKKDFTTTLNKILIDWVRCKGSLAEFFTEFERRSLSYSFDPVLGNYHSVIRRMYNSAFEFVDKGSDPVVVLEKMTDLRERVADWDLDGVTRYRKPRQTWLTMIDVLANDYQFTWNRGYRRLAIEAGVTAPTARNHVNLGIEIGLIQDRSATQTEAEIRSHKPKEVAELAFNLDWGNGIDEFGLEPVKKRKERNFTTRSMGNKGNRCVVKKLTFLNNTVWQYVLGNHRRSTFQALTDTPLKVSQVADLTKVSQPTTRNHLEYLVNKGLVTKTRVAKGKGFEYSVNLDADVSGIEEEAEYWKIQAEEKIQKERLDFYAYSSVWLEWYEQDNQPLVSGGRSYRLNEQGLSYARGKHKAWEHHQIPEEYRDYTLDGSIHRGLWALPDGEILEVNSIHLPPPINATWFDYLDDEQPVLPAGVDPFATPEAEPNQVQDVYQGLPEIPF